MRREQRRLHVRIAYPIEIGMSTEIHDWRMALPKSLTCAPRQQTCPSAPPQTRAEAKPLRHAGVSRPISPLHFRFFKRHNHSSGSKCCRHPPHFRAPRMGRVSFRKLLRYREVNADREASLERSVGEGPHRGWRVGEGQKMAKTLARGAGDRADHIVRLAPRFGHCQRPRPQKMSG